MTGDEVLNKLLKVTDVLTLDQDSLAGKSLFIEDIKLQ